MQIDSRCPMCATTPSGRICGKCGTATVFSADYGLARILIAEGCDPGSVNEALHALSIEERASKHAKWHIQEAKVHEIAVIVEALMKQASIFQSCGDVVADAMIRSFPASAWFFDRATALVATWATLVHDPYARASHVAEHGGWDWLRQLGELAQVAVASEFRQWPQYFHDSGKATLLDAEIALCQFDWRAVALGCRPRWGLVELRSEMQRLAARTDLDARFAAAVVLDDESHAQTYASKLQEGLGDERVTVWFACALALKDAAKLAHASDLDDPILQRVAQRALAQSGSTLAAKRFVTASPEDRASTLRDLRRDGISDKQLPGFLVALRHGTDAERVSFFDLLMRKPRSDWSLDEALGIAEFTRDYPVRDAGFLQRACKMLSWACGDIDRGSSRFDEPALQMLIAVGAALAESSDEQVAELRFDDGLSWWLLAAPYLNDKQLHERICASAKLAELVCRRSLDLHAQRARRDVVETTLLDSLIALWLATPKRDVLAPAMAVAVSQNSHMAGKERLIAWAWEQFCQQPHARAELYTAFRSWSDELFALRNQMPKATRPGGADAGSHVALWGGLDRELVGQALNEAIRIADSEGGFDGIVDALAQLCNASGAALIDPLVAVARLGYHLERDLSATSNEPQQAVAHYVARAKQIVAAAQATAALDPQLHDRCQDITQVVQRIERFYSERREQAQREARREAEQEARRQQIAQQVAQAQEEARRQAEEMHAQIAAQQAAAQAAAQAAIAAALAAATPPQGPGRWSMPHPAQPIDFEPLFPSLPLVNLVDYCRVMVRLNRGANPLTLFPEHGLDPQTFAMCSQQFSLRFATNPALATRFAELLAGNWLG